VTLRKITVADSKAVIALIGGAGNLGAAIAGRLALAGYEVIIGSRDAARAAQAAEKLSVGTPRPVRGAGNQEAANAASIVIVAVPYASQRQVLSEIRAHVIGKIVVDTTVPLNPPKVSRAQLPAEGSAAQIAQQVLGEGVTVVSAFHNVAAHKLALPGPVDCDVLVFGDDKAARDRVIELVVACRLRGLHAGPLANSAAAEALTSVLIFMNRHYAVDGAGLRITGPAP
jgi:8-hydroxy-5-deazaflavin:NADPH oxidoreductase